MVANQYDLQSDLTGCDMHSQPDSIPSLPDDQSICQHFQSEMLSKHTEKQEVCIKKGNYQQSQKNALAKQNKVEVKSDMMRIRTTSGNEQRNIHEDYFFGEILGKGGFATVFKATNKITHQKVAIKQILIDQDSLQSKQEAMREAQVMEQLQHENIVGLIGVYKTKYSVYIVQELMNCSLHDYIQKQGTLSEELAARLLKIIAKGVSFIHSKGFMHFDLKPGNILLDLSSSGHVNSVKIGDFGLTHYTRDKKLHAGRDTQGTLSYMAPEMITAQSKFDDRVEAWSLGILLCKMLTNRLPFFNKDDREMIKDIVLNDLQFGEIGHGNGIWDGVSIEAQDVIQGLLTKMPEDRMTLEQLLKHSWVNNDSLSNKMEQLNNN